MSNSPVKQDETKDKIKRNKACLIIFGISGYIGSGVSFVSKALKEELQSFECFSKIIKVSKLFLENEILVGNRNMMSTCDPELSKVAKRIRKLQDNGNTIRDKYANNILAVLSINCIKRDLPDCSLKTNRRAYIIDSLKHPEEVKLLREVFGNSFFMIGVMADKKVREQRLLHQKSIPLQDFLTISKIDEDEDINCGQKAQKTIQEADYFFENNYDKPSKINQECKRLLDVLFQSSITTPRQDEYGMNLAYMAAQKSACLSRQVGAAIISNDGNLLSTGCNDVPESGGGLYTSESSRDNRCFASSLMCHNDHEKGLIAEEIADILQNRFIVNGECDTKEHIKNILLNETRLKDIIEFSRAVHAETDSIIGVARSAIPGIVGSTMYVTTRPCHNCAKNIIDAGIKRVVFIQPYNKSLSDKLHFDSINNPLEEKSPNKVRFDNYGGISPWRYAEFFTIIRERKDHYRMIQWAHYKDELFPLYAQSSNNVDFEFREFQKWFETKWPDLYEKAKNLQLQTSIS